VDPHLTTDPSFVAEGRFGLHTAAANITLLADAFNGK
jgi:hypothetical protein